MNTLTKSKFKPQFLYKNEHRIKQRIEESNESAVHLTQALLKAQELFDKPLTEIEKRLILSQGSIYLEDLLKKNSQFPKADIETILKLQGHGIPDIDSFKKALSGAKNRGRIEEYDIDQNNVVTLSPDTIEKENAICTYYTRSEKQNVALEVAKTVSESLNKAIKAGAIYEADHPTTHLKKILTRQLLDSGKWGYKPNFEQISML